jgi:hypothetical protein
VLLRLPDLIMNQHGHRTALAPDPCSVTPHIALKYPKSKIQSVQSEAKLFVDQSVPVWSIVKHF